MEKLTGVLSGRGLNTTIKFMCILICAALAFIAFAVYKADFAAFLVFLGFAVFYVQLPGHMILRMLKMRFSHKSTALCTAFFTGWAAVVAQYFLCELIHSDLILYALGPVFSVMFIVQCIREHTGRSRDRRLSAGGNLKFSSMSTAFFMCVTIVFFYAIAATQFQYMNPAHCVSTYMNPDKAYHMGLIDSLSHGWPLESMWVQGRTVKYHIFTELLMAVPVRLFGVPADVAVFTFNPFLTTYAFCLSSYVFYREFLGKSSRAGLCCLVVILSNMYLTRSWHSSLAFHFAIINDNAVGYGISCGMLFAVLFRQWFENPSRRMLIIITVIIMLLTGIKGPVAIVIVGGLWGTFVIGLIMRKVPFRTILPVLILTAGFLVVYLTVMSGKGASNGSGDSIFAFATIANIAFFHDGLILFMKSLGIPKIIRLGVMLVVFMIFLLTAFILPFTIGYIRELFLVFSGKKDYSFPRVLIYACFLVGLVGMFIMNYSGHSQVYFGLVSVFFAPLITFWFFEDMEDNRGALMTIVRIIFIACLLLTSFTLAWHIEGMIGSAVHHSDPDNEYSTYTSITDKEYEAMIWLRENTPEDSLIATDRYASVPPEKYSYEDRWTNRFFLYPVYANRFCYIGGSGYNLPAGDWIIRKEMIETNNQLYDPDNPDRGRLAKELGVDYVVVSKRFNDCQDLTCREYSLCFSNRDIDIYKIRKSEN